MKNGFVVTEGREDGKRVLWIAKVQSLLCLKRQAYHLKKEYAFFAIRGLQKTIRRY